MSFPTIAVKAGFGYTPVTASPVYTDLGSRLRAAAGVQITRGRKDPLSEFDAGQVTLTLGNDDGWLDPTYSGSPYWPNVQPDTPLLVQATYAGVTYDLIKAHVERWTPKRIAQYVAEMPLTGVDLLAAFNGYKFPLHDDGHGGGSGRKHLGTFNHKKNKYSANHSFHGTDEAVRVYAICDASPLSSGTSIGHSDTVIFGVKYTNGNGTSGRHGHLEIKFPDLSAHPHHRRDWLRTLDVVLQGNDTVQSIESVYWKSGKFYGNQLIIKLYGERAIIPRGTGDKQLKSAVKRFGVPSSAVTVRRAGRFTQLPTSPWGGSLLDTIRAIQETEIGQIYIDRHGNVVFEDRDWRYNNWGSPKTWHDGATAGSSAYTYIDCQPSLDRDDVVNRWEITRVSRGPRDTPQKQVATAGGKVRIVGQRSPNIGSDSLALGQAKYLLERTKTPKLKSTLTIRPMANPDLLFPVVLAMELGDPLIVRRYIPIGNQRLFVDSNPFNIEHITHTVRPNEWETELDLSYRITTSFRP